MTDKPALKSRRVLLLTVGTGDSRNREQTLFEPIMWSISKQDPQLIILLPSHETEVLAKEIRNRLPEREIRIEPLPQPGDENDPDKCFSWFDKVIEHLLVEGADIHDLMADFTRGTKAMSAALVLACVRRDVPRLGYVEGTRDERGMVVSGSERIHPIYPSVVTFKRRLDAAYSLFLAGNFSAVLDILPESTPPFDTLIPAIVRKRVTAVRALASFYVAWDRLDYATAAERVPGIGQSDDLSQRWQPMFPTQEVINWVRSLAKKPNRKDEPAMAAHVRRLCCDLFANGERRLRNGQLEDAFLRWYRVVELIGQARLFDRGYDSESITPKDPYLIKAENEAGRKHRSGFDTRSDGRKMASREMGARLLRTLGDEFGQRLMKLADSGAITASRRNRSILVHGFNSLDSRAESQLPVRYRELEQLINDDSPSSAQMLTTARFLDFSK